MKRKNRGVYHLARSLRLLYLKFYRSNDSAQKLAAGFGLGVFLGIMPGLGIIAVVVLATLLRVNRVTALLGTLLTNTWLSFVTLILSIKIGAAVIGLQWQHVYTEWKGILKHFTPLKLFSSSFHDVLLPIGVGFFIVSACLSIIAYVISLFLIIEIKRIKNKLKEPNRKKKD